MVVSLPMHLLEVSTDFQIFLSFPHNPCRGHFTLVKVMQEREDSLYRNAMISITCWRLHMGGRRCCSSFCFEPFSTAPLCHATPHSPHRRRKWLLCTVGVSRRGGETIAITILWLFFIFYFQMLRGRVVKCWNFCICLEVHTPCRRLGNCWLHFAECLMVSFFTTWAGLALDCSSKTPCIRKYLVFDMNLGLLFPF